MPGLNRLKLQRAGQAVAQQVLSALISFSVNHIQKLDVRDRCGEQEGSMEWGKLGPGPAPTSYRQCR